MAFHADNVHRCFLCRTDIQDDKFSEEHHKRLHIIQAYGMFKLIENEIGIEISKEHRNQAARDLLMGPVYKGPYDDNVFEVLR